MDKLGQNIPCLWRTVQLFIDEKKLQIHMDLLIQDMAITTIECWTINFVNGDIPNKLYTSHESHNSTKFGRKEGIGFYIAFKSLGHIAMR